jgi:hypothetical protein
MVEMRPGALEVVLSYVEAAQQARRSQREEDWQRLAELLAEDVVWQLAGYPRTAGCGCRPRR